MAKVIGKLCSTELAVNGIGAAFFFYLAFAVINEGWLIREICHKQSNYPEKRDPGFVGLRGAFLPGALPFKSQEQKYQLSRYFLFR